MTRDFAPYDRRGYQVLSVTDGYSAWSELYDEQLDGNLDIALLERIQGVEWSRVTAAADLGCGTGRIGQWLRQRGVSQIDGVDLTGSMLAQARDKGAYRSLREEDACATSLLASHYDLIVSCMAIGHMPSLDRAFGEMNRLLAPGGHAVLVAFHPFFLLSGIPTHFKDRSGTNRAIQNYVHLMSDHFAAAQQLGWQLLELLERVVDDQWVAMAPGYQRHVGKPVTFAMVWQGPGS